MSRSRFETGHHLDGMFSYSIMIESSGETCGSHCLAIYENIFVNVREILNEMVS